MTKIKDKQAILIEIAELAAELDWVIALPEDDTNSSVPGLIIGEEDFILNVADAYNETLEVYRKSGGGNHEDNSGWH